MFGIRCPGCGRHGWCPCPQCVGALDPAPAVVAPGVDEVAALFAHSGVGRSIVSALKHRDDRSVAAWLGEGLARLRTATAPVDVVTWVPASASRLARRGHDTGRILGREVGRRIDAPVVGLLVRSGGPAQTGRGRADRLGGPALGLERSVAGRGLGRRRGGGRVLVVDDVVTTGASLAAAATLLRAAGAASVTAAVVAVRPYGVPARVHYNHRTRHL